MGFDTRRILYRNLSFLMAIIAFALMFVTVSNQRGQDIVNLLSDFSIFLVTLFSALWMKRQGLYLCLLLGIIYLNIKLLISPIFSPLNSFETIQNLRTINLWIILSIFVLFIISSSEKSPVGFLKKVKPVKDYLIILPAILTLVAVQIILRQF